MKELRGSKKEVLVLDAGDLLFKKFSNPIPENESKVMIQKAYLFIESFNLMGYDAMGIGDDDLSLGKDFLVEISKRANFPLLSSNLIDEETGRPLFQPYLLKEINGHRIGIFSLLSPDSFLGPLDPRRKGLIFQHPIDVAEAMVKELQPKTDLIILLSHLGYPKDIELAKGVSGINFTVSSHTGTHLSNPPIIKNTILLQTAPKGMYAGKLDFTLYNNDPTFYNSMTKRSLENNLNNLKNRLNSKEVPEPQKAQWQKTKEEIESTLKKLQGKNEFTNTISPLHERLREDPDIKKLVDSYKAQFQASGTPSSPK